MTSNKISCASFFAGVGGIDLGFESTGQFEVVYANEFDPYPARTYEINSNLKVDCRDIHEVQPKDIPNFDVLLAGFPCQAFSIAGLRRGFDDEKGRGTLFFELLRIIDAKKPSILFLENVKNLVSHDNGKTFKTILSELEKRGYYVNYKVLNSMHYGNVPQNRERIYIVAFLDEEISNRFMFPLELYLSKGLDDVIDFNSKVDEKYYYTPGKYKNHLYEKLQEAIDDDKAVYQWRRKYVRKNKSGVIPTLTANQGEGGHNVCIVKTRYGIRKMTPHECFNAQGFPDDFKLPKDMSDGRLYKQAGNSVCVSVIERIAEEIYRAYSNDQTPRYDPFTSEEEVDEFIKRMSLDFHEHLDELDKAS